MLSFIIKCAVVGVSYGSSIIITIINPFIGAICLGAITFLIIVYNFYNVYINKDATEINEENMEYGVTGETKCDFTSLKKKISNSFVDEECIICLSFIDEDYIELKCGHIYHDKCIKEWFQIKSSCTICRV